MVLAIIIVMILSLSFLVNILFKIKQEEAIVVSFFGVILITYILGLMNLLGFCVYIIYFLMFISILYTVIMLIKKKVKLRDLFTLPTFIYIGVLTYIYIKVKDTNFIYYDEFMFWGTNLKTMLSESCLWASSKVDGIHLVYPPFTALIEYIFCKINGEFNEGVAYFGLISLIFTSIMPLFKNEKYSLKSLFKIVVTFITLYLTTLLFNYDLTNLSVDCILGVVFAVLMYLVYTLKDKKDYIVLCILLVSITLIKTNGILFAGIAIMQLFFIKLFDLIKERKNINKKEVFRSLLVVGSLLFMIITSSLIWKGYYTLNGKKIDDRHDKNTVETIDFLEYINAITLNGKASERNTKVSKDFYDNLNSLVIIKKDTNNTCMAILIIINIFYFIFIILKKKRLRPIANVLSINIGFIIYILTNLLMFMFVFQYDQGNMLMGFDRYMATYLMAMVLNLVFCLMRTIDIGSIIFICLYLIFLKDVKNNFNYRSTIDEMTINNANEILSKVKKNEKVFIVDQKLDYGYDFMATKYLISPIKTNLLYEWGVGESDYGVYYKIALTLEEFRKKLIDEEYDYLYIISVDYSFLIDYKNLFSEEASKKIRGIEGYWFRTNGVLLDVDKDIIK